MAVRHRDRKAKPNLDEPIKPPEGVEPEEALERLLHGQGARPEDSEPENVPED